MQIRISCLVLRYFWLLNGIQLSASDCEWRKIESFFLYTILQRARIWRRHFWWTACDFSLRNYCKILIDFVSFSFPFVHCTWLYLVVFIFSEVLFSNITFVPNICTWKLYYSYRVTLLFVFVLITSFENVGDMMFGWPIVLFSSFLTFLFRILLCALKSIF